MAAWATFATAVLAAFAAFYVIRQARRQVAAQQEFERRRLRGEYLRGSLLVIHVGYDAAETFRYSLQSFRERVTADTATPAEIWDGERTLHDRCVERWNSFEYEIRSALYVLQSSEGYSPLVTELQRVFDLSTALYRLNIDEWRGIATEEQRQDRTRIVTEVKQSIRTATEMLSSELARLFLPTP